MQLAAAEPMLNAQTEIATIVLDHSECAAVFARRGIDYCCKGKRKLVDACADLGLEVGAVVEELELAIKRRTRDAIDLRTLSTRELIVMVIAKHHQYLHRTLPFLGRLATKVARVHGSREASLHQVVACVEKIASTLESHLKEEERVLFPALMVGQRSLEVVAMLNAMRSEHEAVGEMLANLRAAADDYIAPDWACASYRTLLTELAELEADTLRHVHIENHVLLPRFVSQA